MVDINNLHAHIAYPAGLSNLPILMLMHTWQNDASEYDGAIIQRFAENGFFVCVCGLRGKSGADGTLDASGRDLYDAYDALVYIRANYPTIVSADKAAVVGYSGGGGDALGLACKFPDAWNIIVSCFGMSDYGRDETDGWYANAGPGISRLDISNQVGGTPESAPNNYYARDATIAISNYSGGKLYLFHDDEDSIVPYVHSTRIKNVMDAAGLTNYVYNISSSGDNPRWSHATPTNGASLCAAELIFEPDIKTQDAWIIPASGTVNIIGYVVTKRFTIWLRANGTTSYGIDAAASVVYDTATDTYTISPLTGAIDAIITQGAKSGSASNFNTATEIVVT